MSEQFGYTGDDPSRGTGYADDTDQHAAYGTRVIVATDREAYYVLDEILGNATDLPATARSKVPHMWGTGGRDRVVTMEHDGCSGCRRRNHRPGHGDSAVTARHRG